MPDPLHVAAVFLLAASLAYNLDAGGLAAALALFSFALAAVGYALGTGTDKPRLHTLAPSPARFRRPDPPWGLRVVFDPHPWHGVAIATLILARVLTPQSARDPTPPSSPRLDLRAPTRGPAGSGSEDRRSALAVVGRGSR